MSTQFRNFLVASNLVLNCQIVLGIPVTLIGHSVYQNVFGDLPSSPVVWLMRFVGITLIVAGIRPLGKIRKEVEHKKI